MARILILGGTRSLGHVTALSLLKAGHSVTVLNRGVTPDELPAEVERLRAAREDDAGMRNAVRNRTWDVVVDTTSYTGRDAESVVSVFRDLCSRIVFISTGQVYLVRQNVRAPFRESDYSGPTIPAPSAGTSDYTNWLYGIEKRAAEEVYANASHKNFSVVSLRLPMIASERDYYGRLQGYIARIQDGGPILVPADGSLPVRHVYVEDVAAIIEMLCANSLPYEQGINISFGESISLEEFLGLLSRKVGRDVDVVRVDRSLLESRGLLPACSPYSGKWMSELDNSLSLRAFSPHAVRYTPPEEYVRRIIADYETRWKPGGKAPPGYERRADELEIAKAMGKSRASS